MSLALAAGWASGATPPATFEDEIMVTATGVETEADELPASVDVITRAEIDAAQADTVADLLRRVPGIAVVRSGGEGAVASVFTRGAESDQTLVLLDGVRLTSPYFAGYDWSLLATSGFERVEVARGPYSALWGSDAIAGVVNLIPARGTRRPSAEIRYEGGDGAWRRLEGGLAVACERFDLFVSAFDRKGEGELVNSDFTSRQLLADLGWALQNGGRAGLVVQDVDAETGIPFATPGVPSPERRQWSSQRVLAFPIELRPTQHWTLEATLSQVERDFRFRDPDDPFGFAASDTGADSREVRLASRHRLGDHTLTWGGEWREDRVDDRSSFGVNLDRVEATVTSSFVQDVWRPRHGLTLVAGLRHDETDEWGSRLSPRIDGGLEIGHGVALRVGYGEAFRQPSLGELYFPYSGNPELEPERSRSSDLGLSWLVPSSGARLRIDLFRTTIDELIEFDPHTYAFSNLASASIRGAELALDHALGPALAGSLQLTYLDTEAADGFSLLRRPRWSGSATLSGDLSRRLGADLSLVWVGARDDIDPTTFERRPAPGFSTANLALAYALGNRLEATLRVVNLADRRYEEVLGYPAPRRRLMGGLRWRR